MYGECECIHTPKWFQSLHLNGNFKKIRVFQQDRAYITHDHLICLCLF